MKKKPLTISEYLQSLPIPFRKLIERLRSVILTHFPTIQESIMHEGLWYESKFYLAKIQDHVNLGVGIQGLSTDEIKLFLGTGKTMRHLKFYPSQEINEEDLVRRLTIVWQKVICTESIQWHLEK
jgi:hypothetical protein